MEKSFFEDLNKDIKITSELEKNDNHYIVSAKSIRIPNSIELYKKHSFRNRKIKDIPYEGMPVTIDLKLQRFMNKNNNETISAPLDTILADSNMTNRLYNYCIDLMQYMKLKDISSLTNVSKRNLYYLLEKWENENINNLVLNSIFVYRNEKIAQDKWIIFANHSKKVIYIAENKYDLINKIKRLYDSTNLKTVTIPDDLELYACLKSEQLENITLDNESLKNSMIGLLFKAYVEHRNWAEKLINSTNPIFDYSIDDESRIFMLDSHLLSKKDNLLLINDLKTNKLFSFYYELKLSLTNTGRSAFKNTGTKACSNVFYYSVKETNSDWKNNIFVTTNKYMVILLGYLQTLAFHNLELTSNSELNNYGDYLLNDYVTSHKNLSNKQFVLRWNFINENERR